jgi:hypothetical protein
MARNKKGPKIEGGFVAMEHRRLDSDVFQSLRSTAKIAFMYFRRDMKNGHQTKVILTLSQAKKYGVCSSPSTFDKIKRELVGKGFLDPLEPGGLNQPSVFNLSDRWKWYGKPRFKIVEYKPGVGSKNFRSIWKDKERSKKLVEARHGKKPNTDFV